jgi:delta 1-pyrroline-5-carboxylate dehydrogenase
MELVQSYSPQQPQDLVLEVPATDGDSVARAAQVARQAQKAWAAESPFVRASALASVAEALLRCVSVLGDLFAREVGNPFLDARAEVVRS